MNRELSNQNEYMVVLNAEIGAHKIYPFSTGAQYSKKNTLLYKEDQKDMMYNLVDPRIPNGAVAQDLKEELWRQK